MQKNWLEFFEEFHQANSSFIERLDKKHPNLTATQFQVSMYILAGYRTKKIAKDLGMSLSAVSNQRSRLRKIYNIDKHQSIMTYLMKLKSQQTKNEK